jgi:hypothetical protein
MNAKVLMERGKVKNFRPFTFVLVLGLVLRAFGQVSEYSVKAAYLFNFAKFVEWPSQAFSSGLAPMIIGVLGDDPFGDDLDHVVQGKMVDGHTIEIRRFEDFDPDQIAGLRRCQILFIAYSEKDQLGDILKSLKGASVLTVSEIENFPILGGMILFDQAGKKINLIVNPEAARRAKLEISSRLLQVSKVYKSE